MKIQESAENYLEMILVLKERIGEVRSIDIVNETGYTKPSVSVAMKKLRENGYIKVDDSGHISLEKSGYEIAIQIYERHRTLTQLLMIAGVCEKTAAEDACRIEHVISEESCRCLRNFLSSQNFSDEQLPKGSYPHGYLQLFTKNKL